MHRQKTLLLGLLVSALTACAPEHSVYDVTGVIQAVHSDERQLVIAHDDIAGFMPAMTMSFDVADALDLAALEKGNRVAFKLQRSATELRVLEIEVLDPGALAPVGAGRAGSSGVTASSLAAAQALDRAPDFELVDHTGAPFALADLRGQNVLLDFVFTRCNGPCPLLTSSHVRVQRELSNETAQRTRFVSISIDPEHDTPEKLVEYAEARGADLSTWSFLTGEPSRVANVVKSYHVGTLRQPDGQIDHLVITYLIDGEGMIQRRYVGLEHPASELIADLERLS